MTLILYSRKLFLAVFCLLLSSCDIINPEEGIPAYISVPSITFQTDSLSQSSASHKITDAWIYVDDQLIGTYELPVKVPVLYSGDHQVKVFAGIKSNGIAATRVAYPFFDEHVENVNLKPKETIVISPLIKYSIHATFLWNENFEKDTITLRKGEGSDTVLVVTSENAFEGNGSGKFEIDVARPGFAYLSKQYFKLSTPGAKAYLELNYRSSGQIQIGIQAHYDTYSKLEPALVINPALDASGNPIWNKIYVDLTKAVAENAFSNNFSIYIAAVKKTEVTNQVSYIDNIKLVTQ